MKRLLIALAFCTGQAPAAAADLVLTFTQSIPGNAPVPFELSCAQDRVAARPLSADAFRLPTYVYRADLDVLWTILPMWRSYTQQDSVTEIEDRVDKNSVQVSQERILAHPASERAQARAVEDALQAARLHFSNFAFTDSGKREQVAGMPCEIWVATGGEGADSTSIGEPNSAWRDEVAIAPWNRLTNGRNLEAVSNDAAATFSHWWAGLPVHGGLLTVVRAIPQLGGCPVRLRHYTDGELSVEYTLTGMSVREVPPDVYAAPPGFELHAH